MTQNIYDDPEFFAKYGRLGRSVEGLDGAAEWPALRAMLPDLRGRAVLDLGCGYGWFCRWAREQGAAEVVGLDVSRKMLVRARETTRDKAIRYRQADLETVELPAAACDLVYSSLALHYVAGLSALLAKIHRALAPDGSLVCSVEHPIFTATRQGWIERADGRKLWPVEGYLAEGPRHYDWLGKGVEKHHRTLATWINLLLGSGFALRAIEEWGPSEAQIAAHPEWAAERERPMFLLFAARRE
jgi:ubiquinone/menaquinone biosynthesis C-methylase UbiE